MGAFDTGYDEYVEGREKEKLNPTNADIYRAVGKLEGKFDTYMEHALPKRVSSLERTRAWVTGVVAVVGATLAFMINRDI